MKNFIIFSRLKPIKAAKNEINCGEDNALVYQNEILKKSKKFY